jgi:hypothetical protein
VAFFIFSKLAMFLQRLVNLIPMETFHPLFLAILLLLLLSRCSRYQYSIIDSTLDKNEKGEIIMENDSVQLTYRFSGSGCPAGILIVNKLSEPIYVDWEKSYYTVTLDTVNRQSKTVVKHMQESVGEISAQGVSDNISVLNDRFSISRIGPDSYLEAAPVYLNDKYGDLNHKKSYKKRLKLENRYRNARFAIYDKRNSPFRFNSHLTFSIRPDITQPFVVSNDFWVKETAQCFIEPSELEKIAERHDRFYNSKTTVFGGIVVGIGVAGYLALKLSLLP